MSETSIIQPLTLNQPLIFSTTTGINRVKIHNDSSYYLRVYFGLGAPSRPDSGGWHDTISPGASPVVAVVGAATAPVGLDLTNSLSSGTYQGQIVVLPFLPVGALLGAGGVIGGTALCYLTGYAPDEFAETAGQIEAYVQGAKQGRYQSVDGAIPATSGSLHIDETYAPANAQQGFPIATFNPVVAPNLYAANASVAVGNVPIQCYLYALDITLRARTPAVARATFTPFLRVYDTTGATGHGSGNYLFGSPVSVTMQAPNFGVDRYIFAPSKPLLTGTGVTNHTLASGDVLWFGSSTAWVFAGSLEIDIIAVIGVDLVNVMPLTALVGFNQLSLSGNPALAPSSFNPETY